MSAIQTVLAALTRQGCEPRPHGGGWTSRCPGPLHEPDDGNRALWITEAEDGTVVFDCHGAVDAADVHAAAEAVT